MLSSGSMKGSLDSGFIYIYSGGVPGDADKALTGNNTMLCKISIGSSSTGLTLEAGTTGLVKKPTASVWSGTVVSDGVPTFFRHVSATDTGIESTTEPRIQGSVGLVGTDADLTLASLTMLIGQTQYVRTYTINQPQSASAYELYPTEGPTVSPGDLTSATAASIQSTILAQWPNIAVNDIHLVDDTYNKIPVATLTALQAASGYVDETWVPETHDCDEKAGKQWGWWQTVDPGNVAVGFASITYTINQTQGFAHALLLCVCTEGLYWIQNDGNVYAVDALPGMTENLELYHVVM